MFSHPLLYLRLTLWTLKQASRVFMWFFSPESFSIFFIFFHSFHRFSSVSPLQFAVFFSSSHLLEILSYTFFIVFIATSMFISPFFFYNSPIFLFRHSSTRFFFFLVFILFVAVINLQHLNILNVFHRSSRRNFHVYLSIISAMFLSSTTPQYLFFTISPTSSFFLLQMSSRIIFFYLCKVLFKFKFK